MALIPGDKLGPYEIAGPLGAGGMGEVYRATDTKLKRDVAIKVLPANVANDQERLARFQREAEVLASLNHPHIAHVYGIEGDALVMELVEGEDLSQRIARGPIPIDEALPIARQIAEALEAAHDAGIIHRDLKPANIKVRDDGTVKVLDFGLAKAIEPAPSSGQLANSPTITSPAMTMRGVVLGTAAYMAPEQAKGKAVDRRADIWAFGCVLYEMLTGQRTFAGEDVSDTLVSILRDDPRWVALPSNTPPHVRLLLRRCLQRDPQKRLPHIGAARLDLADADTGEQMKVFAPTPSRWRLAALAAAITAAIVVGVPVFLWTRGEPVAAPAVVKFSIEAPPGSMFTGGNGVPRFAVSPDGTEIVYQIDNGTAAQLFTRRLDAVEGVPLRGTSVDRGGSAMQQAFWSPDGRSLAYFDEDTHQLKRLDRQFGATQVVAAVPGNQYGGAWNDRDVIVFASVATGGIQSVPAAGGAVTQVTKVDPSRHEGTHLWPQFFPDGRHFVYLTSYLDGTPAALFLASLDGAAPRRLIASEAGGNVAAGDYMFFVREGTTVAQRVDLPAAKLVGDPIVIGEAFAHTAPGRAALSVSKTGVLLYSIGGETGDRFDTRWVDRAGRPVAASPRSLSTRIRALRLSPDGSLLAYIRSSLQAVSGTLEIWVQDTTREVETRVAPSPATPGLTLVFAPDSSAIISRSYNNSVYTLLRQRMFGAEPARTIWTGANAELLTAHDWSADGRHVIVNRTNENGNGGLWTVPVNPLEKPSLYMASTVRSGADLSPDGRLLAYTAGAANFGSGQVFLQTFPDALGGKWPVSGLGGTHPRWRPDGRELYFLVGDQLTAVTVSASPRMEIGVPRTLFSIGGSESRENLGSQYPYDVMPKGDGFVFLAPKNVLERMKVVVTTDWFRATGIKH
jgi:Tol biopolymer transport system component/predicted Ser/Thr protein kinase